MGRNDAEEKIDVPVPAQFVCCLGCPECQKCQGCHGYFRFSDGSESREVYDQEDAREILRRALCDRKILLVEYLSLIKIVDHMMYSRYKFVQIFNLQEICLKLALMVRRETSSPHIRRGGGGSSN